MTKKKKVDPRANHTPAQIARLKEHALALYSNDVLNTRHLGEALIEVKKAIGHGQYLRWLDAKKIDRNRAYYCVRVVQGKVTVATARRAKKNTAVGDAKEAFGKFLTFCANERAMQTTEQLAVEMSAVFLSTIKSVCEIRNWKLNKQEVQQAMNRYEGAVQKTLDAIFVLPEAETDMPRASDYFKTNSPRTRGAAAGKR